MSTLTQSKLAPSFKLALGMILAGVAASALAQPSQLPLLTRDGWEGKPNVVFTLDDSGSMDWQYMPDSLGGGYDLGFDPAETNSVPFKRYYFIATNDNDSISGRYRAPAVNSVYYNPAIRYRPWFNSNGTQLPDAPPAAAPVEPMTPGAGTVNLVGISNVNARWCDDASCGWSVATRTLEYAPATYYEFSGDMSTIGNAALYTRIRIADSLTFSRPGSRDDCPDDALNPGTKLCSQALEYQNFANWYTYYRRRMGLAVGATSRAFADQGSGLRVGYGTINGGSRNIDGQTNTILRRGVRTFSGPDREDFFNWLHLQAGLYGTPLRRAMDGVGKYFERSDNNGPWSEDPGSNKSDPHLECRKSYHILMSDGYWNGNDPTTSGATANVDNTPGTTITGPSAQSYSYLPGPPYADSYSKTLADVAMYYWGRDLRPNLANRVRPDTENPAFWQNLVQFTVGLGVGGSLNPDTDLPGLASGALSWPNPTSSNPAKIDDMWHAAVNSHGKFLSASDPDQFAQALSEILQSISERESAEGGAAVSSLTLQANNRKFIPTYQTLKWSGDVLARELDENGLVVQDLWRASEVLPAPANRNIFLGLGGTQTPVEFKWNSMTATQQASLGAAGSQALVNYIRGDRSLEGSVYRERDELSVLGDMVNSTPLLVGGLINEKYNFLTDTSQAGTYRQFLTGKESRTPVLFIGANDGMLHAFRETDGVEVFAFIPQAVTGNLYLQSQPSYSHRFMVDGPMVESDAFFGGQWRNMLVGSIGAGGKSIFALDVTDTDNLGASSVKWEFNSSANLGYVMAPPVVGQMRNGAWVAIFGNGFDSVNGTGVLFIRDIATGAEVKTITVAGGNNNGLGGVSLIKDINNQIVGAYAGDRKGNLWRFDLNSTDTNQWKVGFQNNPLYTALDVNGLAQPIQGAPEYVDHPQGGQMVVFGTGKLYQESDLAYLTPQSLYGVWDKIPGEYNTIATNAFQLSDQLFAQSFDRSQDEVLGGTEYFVSTNTSIDWASYRGWTLPLTLEAGQRSIYAPQLVRGLVLFNTVAPTGGTGLPCDDSRSSGYNVFINPLNGASPLKPMLDTNGDKVIDEDDKVSGVYKTTADGVDKILLGNNGEGSAQDALGAGGTQLRFSQRGFQRYWRQLMNPPTSGM